MTNLHTKPRRAALLAFISVCVVSLSFAATSLGAVKWTLANRKHVSGSGPFTITHTGFAGATRIAISTKAGARTNMQVQWSSVCTPKYSGPLPPPRPPIGYGFFTSVGIGSKVPLSLGLNGKTISSCTITVTVRPWPTTNVGSLYVSMWHN